MSLRTIRRAPKAMPKALATGLPMATAMAMVLALAACQAPPAPRVSAGPGAGGPADPAAVAYCRQQAEDVYNAQNRGARLQTSNRDTPFSGAYTPNTTTRGLSDRYAMDAMIGDCIRNAANRQAGPDLGCLQARLAVTTAEARCCVH